MKDVIRSYGPALIAAVAAALVLVLLFGGKVTVLDAAGKGAYGMTSRLTAGQAGAADRSVRRVFETVSWDASDVVSAVHLKAGQKYGKDSLVKSLSGKNLSVKVTSVELCSGAEAGTDVSGRVLSEDGNYVTFHRSGAYRVRMVVTEEDGKFMNGTMYYGIEPEGALLS